MDALVEWIGGARLGPAPLPLVFSVALLPFWVSFSSHDISLLFSVCTFLTVTLKGSLLCCWILRRATSWLLQGALLCGVMAAQTLLLQSCLQSSLLSVVLLVPPSTFTAICMLHQGGRSDDQAPGPRSGQLIGIFSRGAQEEHGWLAAMLRRVGRVVPVSITNTGAPQFEQQASRCSFAILYHSKTRGRLNIADVPDALYDRELQHLSRALGKSNVIVVADDLEDSGPQMESRILAHQPSIARLSRGIHLFTAKEKTDDRLIKDKVQPLYDIISRGSVAGVTSDAVFVFLVVAPWLYFIFCAYNVIFLITTNLSGSILMCFAIYAANHFWASVYISHPDAERPARPRGRKAARWVGIAAALALMVVELSGLYWEASHVNMVLLITQSLATGLLTLKMSRS